MFQDLPVTPDYACIVGQDVGGTKIATGLVAFPSGRVLAKHVIPTQAKRAGQAVLEDALHEAQALMSEARAASWSFWALESASPKW